MKLLIVLLALCSQAAEARIRPYSESRATPPLRAGKSSLGARFGQGGAFDGALSAGVNYEYMYNRELGFAGQFFYSSYGKTITAGPMEASVSSKAYTFAALANYHPAFVHVKGFDPYVSLGLAHAFVKSEAKVTGIDSPFGDNMPGLSVDGDSTFLAGSLNARYFFDDELSVVGSVGFGLSTLLVGLDYVF